MATSRSPKSFVHEVIAWLSFNIILCKRHIESDVKSISCESQAHSYSHRNQPKEASTKKKSL